MSLTTLQQQANATHLMQPGCFYVDPEEKIDEHRFAAVVWMVSVAAIYIQRGGSSDPKKPDHRMQVAYEDKLMLQVLKRFIEKVSII